MNWEDIKQGNKFILRDLKDSVDGDLWPWLQCLSAIVFVVVVFVFESFMIANIWAMWLLFIAFVAFNLFAMWRTAKLEEKNING